jgi:hypothetical protein
LGNIPIIFRENKIKYQRGILPISAIFVERKRSCENTFIEYIEKNEMSAHKEGTWSLIFDKLEF